MGQTGFAWGASIYLRGAKNVGRIIAKLKKKIIFPSTPVTENTLRG